MADDRKAALHCVPCDILVIVIAQWRSACPMCGRPMDDYRAESYEDVMNVAEFNKFKAQLEFEARVARENEAAMDDAIVARFLAELDAVWPTAPEPGLPPADREDPPLPKALGHGRVAPAQGGE